MDKKTIMIALGGNSLSPKASSGTVGEQFLFTRRTMDHLSEFIIKDYNLCITHVISKKNVSILKWTYIHTPYPPSVVFELYFFSYIRVLY